MDSIHPKDQVALPAQMPVMVLSDCYLFPGCFLPLFIFEERYREMLKHALDGDRMFCIGTRIGKSDDSILPWSTAGLVRACVKQPDGTSHVMLYGIQRINLNGWSDDRPFRIAEIEPIQIQTPPVDAAAALVKESISLLPNPTPSCSDAMQKLKETLNEMTCPDRICDVLAYHFVRNPAALKTLLSEADTLVRLKVLNAELRRL
jgi:ATP-dependent Lon protease